MGRRATLGLAVLLGAGALTGCRPDTPGRACKGPTECFTQEVCANGTCVTRPRATDDGDADLSGESDAAISGDAAPSGDIGADPVGDASDAAPPADAAQ